LTRPTLTRPILTGPILTGPILTGPILANPILANPTLANPTLAGPTGSDAPEDPATRHRTTLTHLRTVTGPAHARLEASLNLLDDDLDLDRYRATLLRFHGFWRVWQPRMAALFGEPAFLAPRRRLHLLRADLAALGLSAAAVAQSPSCPPVPLADPREALGSLYVLEGSTLGGRLVQRHVQARLGALGGAGCSYFNGYGDRTGAMWREFQARLDREPAHHQPAITRGATATFDHLTRWLPPPPKDPDPPAQTKQSKTDSPQR
jgi:heme oxygenase